MFCADADLLRWEPALFIEASFAAQTLLEADAELGGDRLRLIGGASFPASRVRAGHVVTFLDQRVAASLPIVRIDDATSATVHRECGACGTSSIVVRSFAAQRQIVSDLLRKMTEHLPRLELDDGDRASLRRVCALGTLQMIYSSLVAASLDDDADLLIRAELYARLYRKAIRALLDSSESDEDAGYDSRGLRHPAHFADLTD